MKVVDDGKKNRYEVEPRCPYCGAIQSKVTRSRGHTVEFCYACGRNYVLSVEVDIKAHGRKIDPLT